MNHYAALKVAPDATSEDLKKAYRKRLREAHPDMGGDAADFDAVQRAWTELGDPERRAAYDRSLTEPEPVDNDDSPTVPTDEDFFDGFAEVVEDDPVPFPAPAPPPFARPVPSPVPAAPVPVQFPLPFPLTLPGLRRVMGAHLTQADALGVPAAALERWIAADRLAAALCGGFSLLVAAGTAVAVRGAWGSFLADLLANSPLLGLVLVLAVCGLVILGAGLTSAAVLALRAPLRLAARTDRRLLPLLRRLAATCAPLLRALTTCLARTTDKTHGGNHAAD